MDSLKYIAKTHRVVLQWFQAHWGIPGKDGADIMAKEGAKIIHIGGRHLNYLEKRTIIKSNFRKSHKADDWDVIHLWLRTGHDMLDLICEEICKELPKNRKKGSNQ